MLDFFCLTKNKTTKNKQNKEKCLTNPKESGIVYTEKNRKCWKTTFLKILHENIA